MLSIYDLYDLSAIYKNIRAFPEYELNRSILEKVLEVLHQKNNYHTYNIFRIALLTIPNIDLEKYYFIETNNTYTYFPTLLKNEHVIAVLYKSTQLLLDAIDKKERACFLSDCFHNLPIEMAQNNMAIPSSYWNGEIKSIRSNYNNLFLKEEESVLNPPKESLT